MQALPRIEWIGPLAPRALGAEQAARAAFINVNPVAEAIEVGNSEGSDDGKAS